MTTPTGNLNIFEFSKQKIMTRCTTSKIKMASCISVYNVYCCVMLEFIIQIHTLLEFLVGFIAL